MGVSRRTLGLHQAADIVRDSECSNALAIGVEQGHLAGGRPCDIPVAPFFSLFLANQGLTGVHHTQFVLSTIGGLVVNQKIPIGLANRFAWVGQAQQLSFVAVNPHEPALGVLEIDSVGRALKQRLEEITVIRKFGIDKLGIGDLAKQLAP